MLNQTDQRKLVKLLEARTKILEAVASSRDAVGGDYVVARVLNTLNQSSLPALSSDLIGSVAASRPNVIVKLSQAQQDLQSRLQARLASTGDKVAVLVEADKARKAYEVRVSAESVVADTKKSFRITKGMLYFNLKYK